jgi:hypothetical protein
MKRFLPLFIIALAFSSCQEDVKFSDPGFQALKDDVFWRANEARAYVSPTGQLTINAYTEYEIVTLNTASANPGTYILGTANANNFAGYTSSFQDIDLEYGTVAIAGPVSTITLTSTGSGYVDASSVATTGGSGSGLTVNIDAAPAGSVATVTPASRGNGYVAGDIITIAGGNVNAKFRVDNVQNSNGEITITEYDNLNFTVSGTFKFNAAKTNDNPFGGDILNYSNGEFYKIRIYPSI